MKVAFVISECENYAVQLFSAMLKERGHQPYLIFDPRLFANDEVSNNRLANFFDIRKQNINKLKNIKPDLIGFSVYTQDYQWALGMARMIKKEMSTPIIFGGIHCILCPEQVIKEDCVDMVCAGEGEKFIENIGSLPSKYVYPPQPLVEDLDILPFIDRDIFYEQKPLFKQGYTISTGRGCPHQCTFCASDALGRFYRENKLGKYVRQRSVENVIKELDIAQHKYNPKTVYFTDDVFTLSVNWLREFTKQYQHIGIPFYCTANPGTIKDEELHLLKQSGCQMIGFGMQSCNEQTRKTLLKRTGSNARIKQVAKLCHELGIHFSFDHIYNLPTEPLEHQEEAKQFYKETRPDYVNTFTMTYLPKIELNKYLDDTTRKEVDEGKIRTTMLPKSNMFKFIWQLIKKDIRRLIIGRYSDVFFPIQLLFVNMRDNLWIKYGQ